VSRQERENSRNHSPIQGPVVAVAEPNAHDGTDDALGRRDGNTQSRRHDHGDGGTKLHREPTRRRHQCQAVAEVLHDVIAVGPEADDDGGSETT
jgi:hypothetical protein